MSPIDDQPVTRRELRVELTELKEEIFRHFDAVAENIHRDVAGANQDEISLLDDKVNNHEERITALERRA